MLEHADRAIEFTNNFEYEEFIKDKRTIDATIRSLEIIGEAARHIPNSYRVKYHEVSWKKIVGMRDNLCQS